MTEILDILDKLDFFNQRAGRELWQSKPERIQYQDIANFSSDIKKIREFIAKQQAEIEEEKQAYSRLADCYAKEGEETERIRQRLYSYENMFLELGFSLAEVKDIDLKEIRAWKDRMIWHCKECNRLLKENKQLELQIITAKSEAVKEFAEKLKSIFGEQYIGG